MTERQHPYYADACPQCRQGLGEPQYVDEGRVCPHCGYVFDEDEIVKAPAAPHIERDRVAGIQKRLDAITGDTSWGAVMHFQSHAAGDIRYLLELVGILRGDE